MIQFNINLSRTRWDRYLESEYKKRDFCNCRANQVPIVAHPLGGRLQTQPAMAQGPLGGRNGEISLLNPEYLATANQATV